MSVDAVKIIEDGVGVRVEDKLTHRIKYRCFKIRAAETFCATHNYQIVEMKVKL